MDGRRSAVGGRCNLRVLAGSYGVRAPLQKLERLWRYLDSVMVILHLLSRVPSARTTDSSSQQVGISVSLYLSSYILLCNDAFLNLFITANKLKKIPFLPGTHKIFDL